MWIRLNDSSKIILYWLRPVGLLVGLFVLSGCEIALIEGRVTEATPPAPIITAIPTPTPQLVAITAARLNVRRGPGTEFDVVGLLEAGEVVPVIGRNVDERWWQIHYPSGPGGIGWIAAEFTTVQALPIPLPSLTPARPGSTVRPTPTPGLLLEISPATILVSECARLRYEASNLSQLKLNNTLLAEEETRGSQVVCPQVSTTYRLEGVDGRGNSLDREVTVEVIETTPTPAAAGGSIPVSITAGCHLALETLDTPDETLCRFAPDGERIAVPAGDGSLWVIGVSGKPVFQVVDPQSLFRVSGDVLWSPGGRYLAFNTLALDGQGIGVGYFDFVTGVATYFGPGTQEDEDSDAAYPRWTDDAQLVITVYPLGLEDKAHVALLDPEQGNFDGLELLKIETELSFSAGNLGQQVFPWQPGKGWYVGDKPGYEIDF